MKTLALPLFLILLTIVTAPASAQTQIVTSLKPIELIVRAVATDDMKVTSLVGPGDSPHNYALQPSQRRALDQADVIFWVGPGMETFLIKLLDSEEFHDRVYALAEGSESSTESDHHHDHHHDHNHGDGEDPHYWLDPAWAAAKASEIRDILADMEGADQEQLSANLAAFENSVSNAETTIKRDLEPLRDVDLFTYHDAFRRFIEHYELSLTGVLTANPELSPGARHLAEIQKQLREAQRPCLMTEPQFNRQWWHTLTEGMEITFSSWDPLASDIEAGPEGYVRFQESLAAALLDCL